MLTKILLIIIILGTGYGISIFAAPQVATTIDNLIGMPGLSDNLKGKKIILDEVITDIPSVEEVKSGALDFKEKIETGVTTTKETIDSIREGAEKAEETYNDAKETYDELKETFSGATQMLNQAGEKLEQVQGVVEEVNNLTGSGT